MVFYTHTQLVVVCLSFLLFLSIYWSRIQEVVVQNVAGMLSVPHHILGSFLFYNNMCNSFFFFLVVSYQTDFMQALISAKCVNVEASVERGWKMEKESV